MGFFKDDEGKTEKPTADKVQKARNKGKTSISKEFTMAGTLLIAVVTIEQFGGWLMDCFRTNLRWGMNVDLRDHYMTADNILDFEKELLHMAGVVLPPFLTLVAIFVGATMLAGYAQIGIKVAKEAMKPKITTFNPVTNLGKIFQFASVFKTLFSAFKLIVIGSVLYYVLSKEWDAILAMHQSSSFEDNVAFIMGLALKVFFWISLIVLILAIADIAWNRYKHTKELMMTKQEVADERKRTDGDPMIKGRLRNARLTLMKQRMMESIPKADVVITNPTHYSVVLKYERDKNMAPAVVAKGLNDIAMRIREIAKESDIPIMEDPPLARALYRAVDIGQEIPERFFKAVATILGHVYRMRGKVA